MISVFAFRNVLIAGRNALSPLLWPIRKVPSSNVRVRGDHGMLLASNSHGSESPPTNLRLNGDRGTSFSKSRGGFSSAAIEDFRTCGVLR